MPLLCLLAAILCMDRTTLPISSFQMRLKLQFGADVYGWAVGVLYIGYAVAHMPALFLVGKVICCSSTPAHDAACSLPVCVHLLQVGICSRIRAHSTSPMLSHGYAQRLCVSDGAILATTGVSQQDAFMTAQQWVVCYNHHTHHAPPS
jgi:hypothetical protein